MHTAPPTLRARCRNRNPRGFTLIELLVVIGIIAILASLLLPVLRGAMGRAKTTSCQNKVRQIMIAVELFTQEHDDTLAPISAPIFTEHYNPYLGQDNDYWLCPSGDPDPNPISTPNGQVLHYGINHYHYGTGGTVDPNYLSSLNHAKITEIANPSQAIYLADADPTSSPHNIGGAQDGWSDAANWPLTSLAPDRHQDRFYNAGHLDASVHKYPNEPSHQRWGVRKAQ